MSHSNGSQAVPCPCCDVKVYPLRVFSDGECPHCEASLEQIRRAADTEGYAGP